MKSDQWPTKKLGEVLESSDVGVWGSVVLEGARGTSTIRSVNFTDSGDADFRNIALRQIDRKKLEKLLLESGDILLEKSGGGPTQPVGRVVYFTPPDDREYTFANFIQRLRVNPKVADSKFVFYLLFFLYRRGTTEKMQSQTTGIRNLNLKLYLNTEISLPSLEVQKKIVERLDAIQEAQKLNNDLIQKTDELFQSLLHKELNPTGKNWPTKKLGEICDIYQPQTITSNEILKEGPFKVFGANGVIGYYTKYNHEDSEVLVTCRGATCGTINMSEPKSWITGNAMVLHPKDEKVPLKTFLFYTLRHSNLLKTITGTGQPQITRNSLAPFQISLPPLETQKQIVAKLNAVQEYKKGLLEQKAKLQELFDSVLHKSMRGEMVE